MPILQTLEAAIPQRQYGIDGVFFTPAITFLTGATSAPSSFAAHTSVLGMLWPGYGFQTFSSCFFGEDTETVVETPPTPFNFGVDNLNANQKFVRGDTYIFRMTIVNVNDQIPVNLTGGFLVLTAKWHHKDADNNAVFQLKSTTSGITITDATAGEVLITIPPSATVGLPGHVTFLPYDVEYVDAGGNVFTVLRGVFQILPDVSITTS